MALMPHGNRYLGPTAADRMRKRSTSRSTSDDDDTQVVDSDDVLDTAAAMVRQLARPVTCSVDGQLRHLAD